MSIGNPLDIAGDLSHMLRNVLPAAAIEMFADHIHVIGTTGKHPSGPAPLPRVAHVAAADRLDRRVHFAHHLLNPVVFEDVLAQLHIAELPVPPHLIADAPPLDAERFRVAVGGTGFAHEGVRGAIGVFHLGRGRISVAETGVHRDHRLGSDQVAQVNELIHAHVVRLDAGPRGIRPGGPLVALAQAIAPVVAANKVAAGPAIDRSVELFEQFDRVFAEPIRVVGGHEGHTPDLQRAFAGRADRQAAVVGVHAGGELERHLVERRGDLADRLDSFLVFARAPREADGHRRHLGVACENDVASVLLASEQSEFFLVDAHGCEPERIFVVVEDGILPGLVDQAVQDLLLPAEVEERDETMADRVTELEQAAGLAARLEVIKRQADIMLRGYRVRSRIPVIGPLIAWVRRNLTSHLREPYLDPTFERQVAVNRELVTALRELLDRQVDLERRLARFEEEQRHG